MSRSAWFGVLAMVSLSAGGIALLTWFPWAHEEPGSTAARARDADPRFGATYDPLAYALSKRGEVTNLEASIPPMCYTKTGGTSNPCWVCHTEGAPPNRWRDWDLQMEYAFSGVGLENHWSNLFEDRTDPIAAISDETIVDYIRQDNYEPLRHALSAREGYSGYVPDLDFRAGFDDEGFAMDGSQWRAIRYKPFPGAFWPTNGSTDDVFIRLPEAFRPDRDTYKANLSILEASLTAAPGTAREDIVAQVEPLDERAVGVDLDGDGTLEPRVTEIRGLPSHYVGSAASRFAVDLNGYPTGTEFLHSVRYVDPDAPSMIARRMKELRYMRRIRRLDDWGREYRVAHEVEERFRGHTPQYGGDATSGLTGIWEWRLQGFVEDEDGRLRLNTDEENRFCMGCHGAIGVQVDGTFSFPRKVPGADGWRYQDLRGLYDVPQAGHEAPEVLTYFIRNRAADELRANTEMLERFFDEDGNVDRAEVLRAAPGGDRDLAWLLAPTRERALLLDKAYLVIVREQSFVRGRDPIVTPIANVHQNIGENGNTELSEAGHVFRDGVLQLDWRWRPPLAAR